MATLTTSAFQLTPEQVNAVLGDARKTSFVQRYGQQVPMTYGGATAVSVNDIAGGFVGAEAGVKPVEDAAITSAAIALREWAVVIPLSKRVVEANPANVVAQISAKLSEALARAFDTLAITGGGYSGAVYLNQATKSVTLDTAERGEGGVYADLNGGIQLLADDDKNFTGSLFDFRAEPIINSSVDLQGRPVFVDVPVADSNPAYRPGRLFGRPAEFVKGIATGANATQVVGYMGDFSRLAWGIVGNGLELTFSTEGTYVQGGTTHSALQENLVLVRAEALIGVGVLDLDSFVKVVRGDGDNAPVA
jgi:HK97 family phage major capsid protein